MEINNIALVLQGGAMRGNYTAGFLDVLLEHDIHFNNIYATSVGALCGMNYLEGTIGNSYKIVAEHAKDKKFLSFKNIFIKGSFFNFDYLFHDVLKNLHFDTLNFLKDEKRLTMVATDCRNGAGVYFKKGRDIEKNFAYAKATSALPYLTRIKKYDGIPCLDGMLSDPLPYQKAIDDGNKKIVVICTKEKGYRKSKKFNPFLSFICYPFHKEVRYAIANQKDLYNNQMERLDSLSVSDGVFTIYPSEAINISHTENDIEKLRKIYELGRKDAENMLKGLVKFINE